jgi:hypothetical protein
MLQSANVNPPAEELLRVTAGARSLLSHVAAFTFAADGDLEPVYFPEPSAEVDFDLLRVLGTLYLAACFEAAGVIPAAEDLSRLARAGVIHADLGEAAQILQGFWQTRNERASATERRALYADVFGMLGEVERSGRAPNVDFEERLLDLCEAVYRLAGSAGSGVTEIPKLRRAMDRLVDNLRRATSGMTVLMAQDILKTQQAALQLLNHEAVRTALHARDVWDTMDSIDRLLRRSSPNRHPHIERGRAGLTLLVWLGDTRKVNSGLQPLAIRPDDAIVGASVDWLEASLALGEAAKSDPAVPSDEGRPRTSWADVAR